MASFPSIYRARVVQINGLLIDVFVPQVFGEAPIKIDTHLGGPPTETGMGWVIFQGGNPEFPVWAGNLASGGGGNGGGGGGVNEVWVGPGEPPDASVELWFDSDAPPLVDAASLASHLTDPVDAHDASAISVVPAGDLAAINVQEALEELSGDIGSIVTDHGELIGLEDDDHPQYAKGTDLMAHITDTSDAHDASAISFVATGTISATNVQSAIVEANTEGATALANHLADTVDAHDATAISFLTVDPFTATNVQQAIQQAATMGGGGGGAPDDGGYAVVDGGTPSDPGYSIMDGGEP